MARTAATLDAKALAVLAIIFLILVMGFDFDNLFGKDN